MWKLSDEVAPIDAVRYINNMLPRPLGALSTRDGRQRRHPIDPLAVAIKTLDVFRYRSSTNDFFDIAVVETASDNRIVRMESSGWTVMKTGLTKGARTVGMKTRDRLILLNGTEIPQVYLFDGAIHHVRDFGVGEGPDAPVAIDSASPGITGTYEYKITAVYINDGESDPGTASASVSPSNNSVDVSWSAITPPAGMVLGSYRIWRKRTDGTPWNNYYLVDSVPSPTVAYNDVVEDADVFALGEGQQIHENHDQFLHIHSGGVWWTYENRALYWDATNRIHFSDAGFPEQIREIDDPTDIANPEQFIDVPQDDPSNTTISVAIFERYAYVFNRYGVRQVIATGDADVPYTVSMVSNSEDQGLIGPKAHATTDEGIIYYLSTSGIRVIQNTLDAAVNPADEAGGLNLVNKPGPTSVGDPVSQIVSSIPSTLRCDAVVVSFNDLIHFVVAASTEDDVVPTTNNDILIFDTQTKGFSYRKNANVMDLEVVNEESGGYALLSASSDTGMVFEEYVDGQIQDEPADGPYATKVDLDIPWSVVDYYRPVESLYVAQLDRLILDAVNRDTANTDVLISFETSVDGGRKSKVHSLSYGVEGLTAWNDTAYLQTVGAEDDPPTWAAVSDGEFKITIDGVTYDIAGMDFTSVIAMEDVAAVIQATIRTATGSTEFAEWDGSELRIASDDASGSSEVANLTTVSAPAGTDLSGATWLDGAGATEHTPATTNQTTLEWGDETSDASPELWSDEQNERARPRQGTFHGLRGHLVRASASSIGPAIIYGWRIDYYVLPPQARTLT